MAYKHPPRTQGSALADALGQQLPTTVAFDYPTVNAIAAFVAGSGAPAGVSSASAAERMGDTRRQITAVVFELLGREPGADEPLMDAGLDSLAMTHLARVLGRIGEGLGKGSHTRPTQGSALADALGQQLPATVAFDHPTVNAIAAFVAGCGASGTEAGRPAVLSPRLTGGGGGEKRTAIVGMGLRLPRTVTDAQAFWELLATGEQHPHAPDPCNPPPPLRGRCWCGWATHLLRLTRLTSRWRFYHARAGRALGRRPGHVHWAGATAARPGV